jgi:hypothetical protein
MNTAPYKLFEKCVAWGFVIEAPILIWFYSVRDRFHVSVVPGILFVFHFVSYCLMRIFLLPFERHISDETMNTLGYPLMGIFQAIIIGSLFFIRKLKTHPLVAAKTDQGLHHDPRAERSGNELR